MHKLTKCKLIPANLNCSHFLDFLQKPNYFTKMVDRGSATVFLSSLREMNGRDHRKVFVKK